LNIGVAAVAMFIVLRLSLGCHFLYEGVWKINNADKFSAEPFLSEAKGPLAPLYYSMLDDIDGKERLVVKLDEKGNAVKDADGKVAVTSDRTVNAWTKTVANVASSYGLTDEQKKEADNLLEFYKTDLKQYLELNADEIGVHFESLWRYDQEKKSPHNGAPYYEKRAWDRQMELRKEVKTWLTPIEKKGEALAADLWGLLDENQRKHGYISSGWNPLDWTRKEQMDFAVTYSLSAIGLCLMLGFCTRLAALGGAAFMINVVLTQFPWPTVYPPAPAVVGHALFINKDFIELVALLLVAAIGAGRWGGFDAVVSCLWARRRAPKAVPPASGKKKA
jgi:uncharacterized membrane protein YphA (DoxX/SURF4 family)